MSEEIKEYTLKFHKYYERLAPNYGYETRKDTKEFDFNSNNGKLMYATVSEIISPLLQKVEQLEKENILLKEANNYHQEVIKSMKEPENVHHYHLENIKLRARNKQLENIRKEAIELIKKYQRKDEFLNLNEWQTRDLLNILNKGDNNGK